jgi:hypothetical protein
LKIEVNYRTPVGTWFRAGKVKQIKKQRFSKILFQKITDNLPYLRKKSPSPSRR